MDASSYLQRPIRLTEDQIGQLLIDLGAHRYKRQGQNVQADHCFLHHNKSPTLGVGIEWPHQFNCFSCQAKGPDIIALVEKAKKLSREDAFSYLVEMFSIDFGNNKFSLVRRYEDEAEAPPRFVLSKAALAAYPMDVNDGIGYRAANYYLQIDKATADRFRFGYRLKDHRLVFPVWHSDGALGGLIGRSMLLNCSKANRWRNFDPERFKREFVLMGAELAVDKSKPMIVVEGPRDFFKIRSLGWDNVRATLGASASAWQIETLASYGTDIVPLYDMDRAGEEGRRTLRRRLNGRAAMLSFVFPPEAVDPATGKNDPAALDAGSLRSLVSSFKRSFNFAYVQRTPPTPR